MTCEDCKDFKKTEYPQSVYEYLPEDDITKTHGLCMGLTENVWVKPNCNACKSFKPKEDSK